ncbi:hypothetical protein O181_109791 [Austropuccinia psidii MF-1]|uniref:Uncharacterized protein n=1 Tax=Austropuccinia psidii MF-1 TaxID=1389203 RepID=A0A9Q3JXD9_9BASI|nr:hypothetical protein [Austropuccinia psidii MF-1]
MDLIEEIKGWNPNKNFKPSKERATRIKENQEAIQAIEKYWQMEEPSLIQVPPGMEEEVPSSPLQSNSSRPHKPRAISAKPHKDSLVVSTRRKGAQGKNKTSFNWREREADPLRKKLMYLAQEVRKSKN